MMTALKGLIGSKKFWMAVVGSAVVAGLSYANAPVVVIQFVGGLFGVGIGAQGLADFGKSSTQINNNLQVK